MFLQGEVCPCHPAVERLFFHTGHVCLFLVCFGMCQGVVFSSELSQADFNNNTSIFLGTQGRGPSRAQASTGEHGDFVHTCPSWWGFSP